METGTEGLKLFRCEPYGLNLTRNGCSAQRRKARELNADKLKSGKQPVELLRLEKCLTCTVECGVKSELSCNVEGCGKRTEYDGLCDRHFHIKKAETRKKEFMDKDIARAQEPVCKKCQKKTSELPTRNGRPLYNHKRGLCVSCVNNERQKEKRLASSGAAPVRKALSNHGALRDLQQGAIDLDVLADAMSAAEHLAARRPGLKPGKRLRLIGVIYQEIMAEDRE